MPNVTLTIPDDQVARIRAALAKTDYPATLAGYKQLLIDTTRNLVVDYETAQARETALTGIAAPGVVSIT